MVVYEVTAIVDADRMDEYEDYMRTDHIPAVLATGSFLEASFERSDAGRYRVRYVCQSRNVLERYLSEHAPRLRSDFQEHFSDGVRLEREEWDVLERFA